MRMRGEHAVVTGSTSGIGRAIAIAFASEGADVVVTGRDHARGTAVVDEITGAGGSATFVAADLTDEEACRTLVDVALGRMGGLTALANNAAVYLASSESEFVTGINLQLDGGSSIARGLTLG